MPANIDRPRQVPLRLEYEAQVVMKVRDPRLDMDRLFNQPNGFEMVAALVCDDAHVLPRDRVVRLRVQNHPIDRSVMHQVSLLMMLYGGRQQPWDVLGPGRAPGNRRTRVFAAA